MADIASLVLAIASGVEVVAKTSFAVGRLMDEWKDAPAQVLSLSEEVQQFHEIAKKLKEFSLNMEACSRDDIYVAAITSLIRRAELCQRQAVHVMIM